jgi:hypothetical protein
MRERRRDRSGVRAAADGRLDGSPGDGEELTLVRAFELLDVAPRLVSREADGPGPATPESNGAFSALSAIPYHGADQQTELETAR